MLIHPGDGWRLVCLFVCWLCVSTMGLIMLVISRNNNEDRPKVITDYLICDGGAGLGENSV